MLAFLWTLSPSFFTAAPSYAALQQPIFGLYTNNDQAGPTTAFYSTDMKEFFLLYDDVRQAESPREMLLDFLQSTYEAGANLGNWDRAALERQP